MSPGVEGEDFLRSFHDRNPGVTSRCFAFGSVAEKTSSYDLLANLVPKEGPAVSILDLGCGDGYLLAHVASQVAHGSTLAGIDMSTGELAAARARLEAWEVTLRNERAQALSFEDRAFDFVLCHMALMLMSPVDEVVRQVERVLRPGGTFAAVVGGGGVPPGSVFEIFVRNLRLLMRERTDASSLPSLGDPRTRSAQGLASLFSVEAGFLAPPRIEDAIFQLDGTPEEVWRFFDGFYDLSCFDDEGRALLRARTEAELERAKGTDGMVSCAMGLRLLVAKKAG